MNRKVALLLAILLAAGCIAYSNSFIVPFQYDDSMDIVNNPNIKKMELVLHPSRALSFAGNDYFKYFHSRLVGFISFAVDYQLYGLKPAGFHLTNLIIHLANAMLLFALVRLLLDTPAMSGVSRSDFVRYGIAFAASLVFVTHPVQTQAVTYIKQRFASLATLWYLSSLCCYLLSRMDGRSRGARYALYAASLCLCAIGMKTKETVFTLPAMLVAVELMFLKRTSMRRLLPFVPHFLTMLIIPYSLYCTGVTNAKDLEEVTRVQTDIGRWPYFLTELRVIATYLRLLILPVGQNLDYDYPEYFHLTDLPVALSALLHVSLLAAAALIWKRLVPRRPEMLLAVFGIMWFYVTLSVESGLVPIVDLINEHRLYLPSAGAFIAAAALIVPAAGSNERMRRISTWLLAILAVVLVNATFTRNLVWIDDLTLWQDVVDKSPRKGRGYLGLAGAYATIKKYDEVFANLDKARSLMPGDPEPIRVKALYLVEVGKVDEAAALFDEVIRMQPDADANYNNAGHLYMKKGQIAKAEGYFKKAIALKPTNAEAYYNLYVLYKNAGRTDDAERCRAKARELNPEKYRNR